MKDSSEMATEISPAKPESRYLRLLHRVTLVAVAVGAIGSVSFVLRAGQRTPRLLLVLFIIWVLSPFAVLFWANMVSKRWSVVTQVTLYCVTLIVTLGSLATYGELIDLKPAKSANAFLFVIVPPISWMFMVIVIPMAAFISNRLSRQGVRQV